MYIPSDADKSIGQSAGAALILWLGRGIVAEHSLNVETQHKTQETACLTILRETLWQVRQQLSHTYTVYKAFSCLRLREERYLDFETETVARKNITSTTW